MKGFRKSVLILVSMSVFVCLFWLLLIIVGLYGYASITTFKNGVVESTGKVDLLSLSATVYSKENIEGNIYENVMAYRPFRQEFSFGYRNGVLYWARIGNNLIDNPELLREREEDGFSLLVKTRQDFSDVMPPK